MVPDLKLEISVYAWMTYILFSSQQPMSPRLADTDEPCSENGKIFSTLWVHPGNHLHARDALDKAWTASARVAPKLLSNLGPKITNRLKYGSCKHVKMWEKGPELAAQLSKVVLIDLSV